MADHYNILAQGSPGSQAQHSDPLDRFWNLYLLDAEKEDARLIARWKGDADGILIFTGLFATTVGSFIIATYPGLQPSSADRSAATLLVIAQQLGQITQLLASPGNPIPQSPLNITTLETFMVPPVAVKVNILWVLSFFLSLFSALLATLVQQWSRTYIGDTQRRGTPRTRGAIHAFLRVGVRRFGFTHAVDAVITLLHISVLLFAAGFLVFMYNINDLVARTLLGTAIVGSVLYLGITLLPIFFPDCPFSTPLTLAIRLIAKYPATAAMRIIWRKRGTKLWEKGIKDGWDWWYHTFARLSSPSRRHAFTLCRTERSYQQPVHVLNQMVASLDENDEIFEFIVSLPHYLTYLVSLGYNIPKNLWLHFPHKQFLPPLLERLLLSFGTSSSSNLVLSPLKIDQLTRLVFLANAAGVDHGNPNLIISPDGNWIHRRYETTMRVRSHFTVDNSGRWDVLVDDRNPVVSFLAHCLISSLYVIGRPSQKTTIDDVDLFDGSHRWYLLGGPILQLSDDNLLWHLSFLPPSFLNIYRLLLFIRIILHYASIPENPVAAHQSVWTPVLEGLCDLTMELDFARIPREACTVIWRVLSIIGRGDLISRLAKLPQIGKPQQEYTDVFNRYPILETALSRLANATASRYDRSYIQRRRSTPPALQMLNIPSEPPNLRRGRTNTRDHKPRHQRQQPLLIQLSPERVVRHLSLSPGRRRGSTPEFINDGMTVVEVIRAQNDRSSIGDTVQNTGLLRRAIGLLRLPRFLSRNPDTQQAELLV